jgi:uncharacterized protein (TIGR02453 family)
MQKSLSFIKSLKLNNNREWFHANKGHYEEARNEFHSFIENISNEIGLLDPDLGQVDVRSSVFRINRDIRFSKDKSPYKTNFGAFIAKGGKKSGNAGYYFHLEPGNSFAGGGIYHPPPDALKAIRNEIYENAEEFVGIIRNKEFYDYFGDLWDGDMLKTPPKGFPKDFKHIDLLRHKSYTVWRNVDDEMLLGETLTDVTLQTFRLMIPLNRFINFSLGG